MNWNDLARLQAEKQLAETQPQPQQPPRPKRLTSRSRRGRLLSDEIWQARELERQGHGHQPLLIEAQPTTALDPLEPTTPPTAARDGYRQPGCLAPANQPRMEDERRERARAASRGQNLPTWDLPGGTLKKSGEGAQ